MLVLGLRFLILMMHSNKIINMAGLRILNALSFSGKSICKILSLSRLQWNYLLTGVERNY